MIENIKIISSEVLSTFKKADKSLRYGLYTEVNSNGDIKIYYVYVFYRTPEKRFSYFQTFKLQTDEGWDSRVRK